MAASAELFKQVRSHFVWSWKDNSLTGASDVRKLYKEREWLGLNGVFNRAPWVRDRKIKLVMKDFEPKAIKTIQNVADMIALKAK
jgi:hypothetical protein